MAAGDYHSVARRSDGTVIAWGYNGHGQCAVPPLPPGLAYERIAAGKGFTLASRSDGVILAWGENGLGQCQVPALPGGAAVTGLCAGWTHALALVEAPVYSYCLGDGTGPACPCANTGSAGNGCDNSNSTGGARLTSSGNASLSTDTLVLASSGELPSALSIVLQGDAASATVHFGDGLRCTGGALKRLYVKSALSGSLSAPQAGDPSISGRAASLGDAITQGALRYYQVYYRDPAPGFCPAPQGGSFNVSNGIEVRW